MPNFYKDNDDIQFHMKHIDLKRVIELKEDDFKEKEKYDYAPVNVDDAMDNFDRILEIVGDISGNVIEPLAVDADVEEAHFKDGVVEYASGTKVAMDLFKKADLMGFTLPRKYGGLNCPITLYSMAIEMVSRGDAGLMNLFGLQDIAETINKFADEDIKMKFLPRFCTGEVTGSMALTEPDAGSDLQAVMTKAYQDKDGNWFLKGVKRFITNGCGEISLVLARSEEGTQDGRGLSMFVYERDSKMIIRRIEHKMGIHTSPTCELQFNDAPCVLVGKRKYGLIKYVMSLMNGARLAISAQALGIAEAAYAAADKYAEERAQFRKSIKTMLPVAEMLANMRTKIEAGRTLLYETSIVVDLRDELDHRIQKYPELKDSLNEDLKWYTSLAALMTPLVKAFNTEMANEVAYDGIQIHGGTGFTREFSAERHYRDARITNIYEGTTQLQVVAAIGGIIKGVAFKQWDKYEAEFDFESNRPSHKIVQQMRKLTEKAVEYIKEKNDADYQEYHARRLVEMTNNVFIGYLMLRDASRSDRKKDVLKYFLEYALLENKLRHDAIMRDTQSLIERKDVILDGAN